jgi:mannose-6-phosphate isomerase-like protein (cupin superfamily)
MKGYVGNLEAAALANNDFRRVLYTARNSQLVLMSLGAGEEIGEETHELDQFLRFESGEGKVVLDGVEHAVKDGSAALVPAGTRHNVINTGVGTLKLYTVYSPPEHRDGVLHRTKEEALADSEHFDGRTSE